MSYEKQNWKNGDVITESKLNHMEDGIATGGGVLVVNATMEGSAMTLDHTWQEIYDAGAAMLWTQVGELSKKSGWLVAVRVYDGAYVCAFSMQGSSEPMLFTTDSADGYPSTTMG